LVPLLLSVVAAAALLIGARLRLLIGAAAAGAGPLRALAVRALSGRGRLLLLLSALLLALPILLCLALLALPILLCLALLTLLATLTLRLTLLAALACAAARADALAALAILELNLVLDAQLRNGPAIDPAVRLQVLALLEPDQGIPGPAIEPAGDLDTESPLDQHFLDDANFFRREIREGEGRAAAAADAGR
jgi:hypothetical protein